jgi:molybdate transport system substrate-binding protein
MGSRTLFTALALVFALATAPCARAADIKVFASNGVRAALEELVPGFETEVGSKVELTFDAGEVLRRRIESGEAFDVAILTRVGIDDLVRAGKVGESSLTPIARSGVGIGIRKGAPRADIGTADALMRTMLAATSVSWAKEGASSVHFASVLERIGIADRMKSKEILADTGADVGKLLAQGQVQYGALLVNELMGTPGVEVLGPLPPDLQSWVEFTAGVASASASRDAAAALIRFLTAPPAGAVFKAKGQDPG